MKKAATLVKQINELYLELLRNYSHREICQAIEKTPGTDWFLTNLYDYCDDNEEEAMYDRISEDIIPIIKARQYYEKDLIRYGFTKSEIENSSGIDFVEMLNEINIYDCGTCFYLVREDISPSELHEVVYG